MPEGYPDSVSEEYLQYQFWDTVQAICSYLRGVLATQALMKGVGVGNTAATPLAAALQWMLRDGVGMLGQLAFTTAAAPHFSVNLKSWRLFADLINNVGLTLDLVAPMAGSDGFIYVASIAQVCKAMCGVAAGATKAALTVHFSLRDNMADVQAKEGSQETFVTLLGLLMGMRFAAYANDSALTIWVAFTVLTVLHCIANYRGVRCLQLPSLNPARIELLIEAYSGLSLKGAEVGEHALSVPRINSRERVLAPLLPPCCRRRRHGPVRLGARLSEAGVRTAAQLRQLLPSTEPSRHYAVCSNGVAAFALLAKDAGPEDQLLAYFEARALQRALDQAREDGREPGPEGRRPAEASAEAQRFLARVREAGWDTARGVAGAGSWRYTWWQPAPRAE